MNFDPESSKLGPEPLMMDSSIAQKILWEEGVVSQHYNECYQLLPADKLDLLLNLRPETQQMIVQYIRGEISGEGLSEREKNLMKKLQSDYNHFLQEQQNGSNEDALSAPFQIKLDRLNRIVYNNFFHRISFLVLERKENMKDKERAGEIAIKLGIKKPLNN